MQMGKAMNRKKHNLQNEENALERGEAQEKDNAKGKVMAKEKDI